MLFIILIKINFILKITKVISILKLQSKNATVHLNTVQSKENIQLEHLRDVKFISIGADIKDIVFEPVHRIFDCFSRYICLDKNTSGNNIVHVFYVEHS